MNDFINISQNTANYFAIFTLIAIAALISERSGMINLGMEGYGVIGALTFAILGRNLNSLGNWTQLLAFVIAGCVAGLFSLLHVYASIKLKANQVVTGTVINLLGQSLGLFIVESKIFENNIFVTSGYDKISLDNQNILSIYLILAFIITIVAGLYFTFTKTGTRHIAAGENPHALDAAGVSVKKYRVWASIISSVLAGVAGAFYVMLIRPDKAFHGSFNGFGFLGIAIMILGQWRVKFTVLFSFLFALLFAFSNSLSTMTGVTQWFKDNSILFQALPFIGSLLFMIIFAKWSKPPKASGVAFDKTQR